MQEVLCLVEDGDARVILAHAVLVFVLLARCKAIG